MNTTDTPTQVRIKEIAYTGYPVTDLARSRAFYEGLLGLKTSTVFDHEGRGWIEYDVGTSTLAITNMSSEHWKPSHDGPSIAFEVEDFDAAIGAMKAAGVTFYVEPMNTGVCSLAAVADPDGNSVILHRRNG
jgi:catechol 2,3-dioxygenase-like lactoylglutathione lyase family enzyme